MNEYLTDYEPKTKKVEEGGYGSFKNIIRQKDMELIENCGKIQFLEEQLSILERKVKMYEGDNKHRLSDNTITAKMIKDLRD